MARDDAIATLVGILRTTSITGTVIKAPAAPTIPETIPIIKAKITARGLLNVTSLTSCSSVPRLGKNIIIAAISAKMA